MSRERTAPNPGGMQPIRASPRPASGATPARALRGAEAPVDSRGAPASVADARAADAFGQSETLVDTSRPCLTGSRRGSISRYRRLDPSDPLLQEPRVPDSLRLSSEQTRGIWADELRTFVEQMGTVTQPTTPRDDEALALPASFVPPGGSQVRDLLEHAQGGEQVFELEPPRALSPEELVAARTAFKQLYRWVEGLQAEGFGFTEAQRDRIVLELLERAAAVLHGQDVRLQLVVPAKPASPFLRVADHGEHRLNAQVESFVHGQQLPAFHFAYEPAVLLDNPGATAAFNDESMGLLLSHRGVLKPGERDAAVLHELVHARVSARAARGDPDPFHFETENTAALLRPMVPGVYEDLCASEVSAYGLNARQSVNQVLAAPSSGEDVSRPLASLKLALTLELLTSIRALAVARQAPRATAVEYREDGGYPEVLMSLATKESGTPAARVRVPLATSSGAPVDEAALLAQAHQQVERTLHAVQASLSINRVAQAVVQKLEATPSARSENLLLVDALRSLRERDVESTEPGGALTHRVAVERFNELLERIWERERSGVVGR